MGSGLRAQERGGSGPFEVISGRVDDVDSYANMVAGVEIRSWRAGPGAELGRIPNTDTFRDLRRSADAKRIPRLLVHRIDDELLFANAAFFVRDVKARLSESDPRAEVLIIDAEGMSDIDTTAIEQLGELFGDLGSGRRAPHMRARRGHLRRVGTPSRTISDGARFCFSRRDMSFIAGSTWAKNAL
jgi:MFS superfamily sulfate permease-like transporter